MKVAKVVQLNEAKDLKSQLHPLDNDIQKLFQALQGRLKFGTGVDGARGENIAGRFQTFTTSATPDAENTVAHGLGAIPSGLYLIMSQDKAGDLYLGASAWTSVNSFFKSNIASVTFKVFILP